jgi:D-alanyl-D-alanine carboxypeptidase (penicillin-binding protein 5/6)
VSKFLLSFLFILGTFLPLKGFALETPAKQVILVDYDTGNILFEKNADERMFPSSMSKIMTIYNVFQALKDGSLQLKDNFRVSRKAWKKGGSKMFLRAGSRVNVEDLIRGVIVQSGNDASIVLAEGLSGSEGAFSDSLNENAKKLGMDSSNFLNASGWPDPEHYTTARDLSKVTIATIQNFPKYYHFYSQKTFTYAGIKQNNRNPTLYKDIGADGLKTGHTAAAGYGLAASAIRNGRRLVLILNGLKTSRQRSLESERILDWGYRVFSNYKLFKPRQIVTHAKVWMGDKSRVGLVLDKGLVMSLRKNIVDKINIKAVFNEPVPAPISKGDQIGKLLVSVPGKNQLEIPMYASQGVAKLGWFYRIGAAISYILWGEVG